MKLKIFITVLNWMFQQLAQKVWWNSKILFFGNHFWDSPFALDCEIISLKSYHIAAESTNEKINSLHEIKFFSIFLFYYFYNNLSDYFISWIINEQDPKFNFSKTRFLIELDFCWVEQKPKNVVFIKLNSIWHRFEIQYDTLFIGNSEISSSSVSCELGLGIRLGIRVRNWG